VAPGNPYLGVMLPYTPLHHLLMEALARPVVCTSGNLSEEPMAIDTPDALVRLAPIADRLLVHDRPIVRPVDDSVARLGPQGLQVLRRARGYAPLPIRLRFAAPPILALGGHLKNAVALSLGDGTGAASVVLSPHVGDLDNVLSVEVFRRAIDDLVEFFAVVPQRVACDLHPDYASTRQAEELAGRWNVPLVRVQHHHAHVAACMAEHGLEGPVLGLAWDGTGYGPDGTVWGGEALVCRGSEFRRLAHLRTFGLPGGDRAVREPRRTALGLLFEILGQGALPLVEYWFRPAERKVLPALLASRRHTPRTSSMGRLFDAVAALVGLPPVVTFEAQAAMALEFAADPSVEEAYPLPLVPAGAVEELSVVSCQLSSPDSPPLARERSAVSDQRSAGAKPADSPLAPRPSPLAPRPSPLLTADWEPLARAVLADRAAGEPVGRISARFHNALAELAVAVARHGDCGQVCLSGGCFQNALLTERVFQRLTASGYSVFMHRQVPPGDGGIALGQVFVAAYCQLPVASRNRRPTAGNCPPSSDNRQLTTDN
jgi:hydrogenase maturation protein HypF